MLSGYTIFCQRVRHGFDDLSRSLWMRVVVQEHRRRKGLRVEVTSGELVRELVQTLSYVVARWERKDDTYWFTSSALRSQDTNTSDDVLIIHQSSHIIIRDRVYHSCNYVSRLRYIISKDESWVEYHITDCMNERGSTGTWTTVRTSSRIHFTRTCARTCENGTICSALRAQWCYLLIH